MKTSKPVAGTVVKQTMYIHLCSWNEEGVCLYASDMSKAENQIFPYICIGTVDVEYVIPVHDETALRIQSLEDHLKKIDAEHHVKRENIKEQIQSLLAISYDGGETE